MLIEQHVLQIMHKKVSFKIAKGYLVLIIWLTIYLMRKLFWKSRVVSSLEKGFDIGNTCCLIYSYFQTYGI